MNTVRSVKQKFNGKDFLLEQLHKRIKRRKELLADGTFVLCEDCGTDAHKDELVNMGDHLVCESCYKSEIDPTYEYENDE